MSGFRRGRITDHAAGRTRLEVSILHPETLRRHGYGKRPVQHTGSLQPFLLLKAQDLVQIELSDQYGEPVRWIAQVCSKALARRRPTQQPAANIPYFDERKPFTQIPFTLNGHGEIGHVDTCLDGSDSD